MIITRRGRGRPKEFDSKEVQYRLRMTREDAEMLSYLSKNEGITKADIIRKALRSMYYERKNRDDYDDQFNDFM